MSKSIDPRVGGTIVGGEVNSDLVGLITRRSRVQITPPLLPFQTSVSSQKESGTSDAPQSVAVASGLGKRLAIAVAMAPVAVALGVALFPAGALLVPVFLAAEAAGRAGDALARGRR